MMKKIIYTLMALSLLLSCGKDINNEVIDALFFGAGTGIADPGDNNPGGDNPGGNNPAEEESGWEGEWNCAGRVLHFSPNASYANRFDMTDDGFESVKTFLVPAVIRDEATDELLFPAQKLASLKYDGASYYYIGVDDGNIRSGHSEDKLHVIARARMSEDRQSFTLSGEQYTDGGVNYKVSKLSVLEYASKDYVDDKGQTVTAGWYLTTLPDLELPLVFTRVKL